MGCPLGFKWWLVNKETVYGTIFKNFGTILKIYGTILKFYRHGYSYLVMLL